MPSFDPSRSARRRPSLRETVSADSTTGPSQATANFQTRAPGLSPSDHITEQQDPRHPGLRKRGSSFVHFDDEVQVFGDRRPAASSATRVGSRGEGELKRRLPYTEDETPRLGSVEKFEDPVEPPIPEVPVEERKKASHVVAATVGSYKQRVLMLRQQSREIFEHVERKSSPMSLEGVQGMISYFAQHMKPFFSLLAIIHGMVDMGRYKMVQEYLSFVLVLFASMVADNYFMAQF